MQLFMQRSRIYYLIVLTDRITKSLDPHVEERQEIACKGRDSNLKVKPRL